jgi:hypothetical protein
MPAIRTRNSTTRRLELADFIDIFGDTIVQKCSNYVKHNRAYKVYLRLGKCNYYNYQNQRYDVKVT